MAADVDASVIETLQKQIQALTEEVERLKEGPVSAEDAKALLGEDFLKQKGLTIGFYGEAKYRFPEAGNDTFDPHRFVLTPSYQLADWLVFNSELEFEHGGLDEVAGTTGSGSSRSRFDGEIEIEQFYVDILLNPHFNIRSLGIDLVPVGRINKYHEPTVFYSTERPELYREIIPSTWFEPSMGAFGQITETLDYQVMVSTGLEDFISGSTAPGITAGNGMRAARPRYRQADEENLAYTGRIHYHGVPGLDASTSAYATKVRGFNEGESVLILVDVEAAYRVPRTGLELRGEFAYWFINDPQNLIANNNAATSDDVGDHMYGWYVEAAYHLWQHTPESWRQGRGAKMDLVPFIRYTEIVTQAGLAPTSSRLDTGATNKEFLTAGLAWFLSPNFVVKGDWRRNLNGGRAVETSAANQDYFQMGVGVVF
ncbi:MAG TPA: hypothetical protein VNO52_06975 [Methylomirabilota bacterium]|nr:hypothetical protein [Methylomirabilota bacterium]